VIVGLACGYVGAALHPTLAVEHPSLLIALNPRNYHLALVAREMTFGVYFTIAVLRLLSTDPLLFLVGWHYGDAGRAWVDRQIEGSAPTVAWIDRWFPKLRGPIVFIAPNAFVSLLAGVTRMRPALFFGLNIVGTFARVTVVWWLAGEFEDQLDSVLDFFNRYQWPATLVAVGLVVVQIVFSARRGRGDVKDMLELEHDIEDQVNASEHPAPPAAEATREEAAE
jgi:membrane protein DedA with SNARE-associated domain